MRYRALWAIATAGGAVHFAGLGWHVSRHATRSGGEGALALGNASHLMVVVGMSILVAALVGVLAVWVNERQLGGARPAGLLVRGASLPLVAVAAAGSIWLVSTAGDFGGAQPQVTQAPGLDALSVPVSVAVGADSAGQPAAAAADSVASADGHVHTTPSAAAGAAGQHAEVAATAEQMVAAGEFALQVKEKTAKYADITEGMRAGYVQITQDLEGIAAHFIRSDFQRDGRELDPDYPEVLLYSKRLDGTWRFVGVMFLAEAQGDTPPQYFGSLDAWHRHENLCFTAGARVSTTASAGDCRSGVFVAKTAYQLHVWVLPGGTGVFAHDYAPIAPGGFPGGTIPAASELRVQAR